MNNMKNTWHKLLIICFCVLSVLLSAVPVSAEEDDETKTIHSTFYVLTVGENRTMDVRFNPNWFKQDAEVYSHDLAKLSLGLATSAFRPQKSLSGENDRADTNLYEFLTEAGFDELRSDDYDKDPNRYTISTVMGHQKIGEGDEAFELIAVGLCGQGYLDEWESNFSIGSGLEHDGFSRSSQLVYDRICGYIASEHLQGPYKIWLSGFSRAAAVSNITAARLSDSSLFDVHSVFAYTFATPMTTRENTEGRYRNIFNIVGKADPVPTIPYADWGYSRYGTTLYTPSVQTDADYFERRKNADVIYKNLTGIDYWVNPQADAMSRTVLAYLQTICPTADIYASSLQDKLIHLWEDRSPINVISSLLDIANDPVLINEETRTEANGLMDYLALVLLDYGNSSQTFRRWNSRASLGANVLQAHTPELYISWVFSADSGEELYTDADSYRMVYAMHTSGLSMSKNGEIIEEITPGEDETVPHVYLDETDDYLTAMIPSDEEITLYMKPEGEWMIDTYELDYTVGRQSNDHTTMYSFEIPMDETLEIRYSKDGSTYYSQEEALSEDQVIKDELNFSQSSITNLIRNRLSDWTWRNVALFLLSIPVVIIALILFQVSYVVSRIRFNQKVKRGWFPKGTKYRALPFFLVILIFLLYMMMQFSVALFPDSTDIVLRYKKSIDFFTVLLAMIGWLYRKDAFTGFTALDVVLLAAADLTITVSMTAGAILHVCAYLVLSFIYIQKEGFSKRQIVLFILLGGFSIWNIMNIKGDYGILRYIALAYGIAASLMIVSSITLPRRLFVGSIALFVGGILLINNQTGNASFLNHFISLGVYYLAVLLIASAGTQTRLPHLVPESEQDDYDETEIIPLPAIEEAETKK